MLLFCANSRVFNSLIPSSNGVPPWLPQIVGKDVMDELTFVPRYERKKFLSSRLGDEVAELYQLIFLMLWKNRFLLLD